MKLNVAVVHNEVFCEEALEYVSINYIEFIVALQACHQPGHIFFKVLPFLAIRLHLGLRLR